MLLGLIADTHDYFDPQLPAIFRGVERILHAGDICSFKVLNQLEAIAPVTAVLGNNDYDMDLRETEVIELGGQRFLVHHIVRPEALTPALLSRIEAVRPDVVVFGHSHQRFDQIRDGVRFLNPGCAGRQRFKLQRSVARMRIDPTEVRFDFLDL